MVVARTSTKGLDELMSATGLHYSIYIATLLVAVPFSTVVAQTNFTQAPPSADRSGEHQSDQAASVFAIQPGMGFGFSAGFNGLAGGSRGGIQNTVGYAAYLRYGAPFGLFVLGGVHFSTHEIDGAKPTYRLTSFFLEPRFVALKVSSRWAPFVSGRLALVQEGVDLVGAKFMASGYSFGGGAGALFYLTPQVALEGLFSVGVARLNDYVFRGEVVWYNCLEELSSGASLPESVILCDGPRVGGRINCYPPFFVKSGSGCVPPAIPYADSGRSITWYEVRLGIQLSLASPRSQPVIR